ncbi:MAG: hypothetical protein DMF61_14720 [Blastocatellia bacterium AA13]|nr:MAG: hypothetical protein DMF61_14720 [Blastocatellia bacterium AA13]
MIGDWVPDMGLLASKLKLLLILSATTALVVVGVLNLRDRLRQKPIPYDGISWVDTADGVKAQSVSEDSPLVLALRPGDYVRGFLYHGKYELVKQAENVSLYLDRVKVGGDARYTVYHSDPALQNILRISEPVYDVDFKVTSAPKHIGRDLYLALIGLVYLIIGLFVLFKQKRAALTYHFFAWFLASFAAYFLNATTEFTRLDKTVDFLDFAATAMLAPLFLHFCIRFSTNRKLFRGIRGMSLLLYAPAFILIVLKALWHYHPRTFGRGALIAVGDALEISELTQYSLFFVAGGVLLLRSFIRAKSPALKQQLKWIVWGLSLSGLPFVVLYFIPYVSNMEVTPLMESLAYGPLILIPLSFGYSIIRFRLMDVDVIVRQSFVHVMATIAVGAIYMAVLLGVGDLVKFIWATADLNSWTTRAVVVGGMLLVAMLFAPIKNRLQFYADRWFYGERYTLRMGLQDFGRTLSQTTALPHLLDSLVRRLGDMLSISKIVVLIEDPSAPSGFRITRAAGLEGDVYLPEGLRRLLRVHSIGRGYVAIDDLDVDSRNSSSGDDGPDDNPIADSTPQSSREIYYYFPCIVRDKMVAVIGLGRTGSGALLSSEDVDLVRTLSGYVAVAIDNSLLYRSEMEKADELARLKEFSENIIESVSVGILVVDMSAEITTWNTALEQIFGISREQAVGRLIGDVVSFDLIETIQSAMGTGGWDAREVRQIYKYSALTDDGRPRVLNLVIAPFEAARGVVTGTLIVIENVTERAQLEQQLLEREKLSSIGLLAAGVAHEVNTPLAGISSYAQMLLQQVSDRDPNHLLLEKIHMQTVRASGIVNNLLNFSRMGDAQFREVDINRVLDDTLQLLEPQLRSSDIQIRRINGEDLPLAWANASKLQQVFMNLILNARDAMPVGGTLSIHTGALDGSLVLDFKDSGMGIAPENIARIYDPFFTTKEVGRGTGLGLALSYGIIQEHGGRIFVESKPGEGAHFTIKLPTAMSRQMQVASD